MTVRLYNNTSNTNELDKSLDLVATVSGQLRESTNIISPSITVTLGTIPLSNFNYVGISEFSRYYYIREVNCVREGVFQLDLKVDVLYTYRDDIRKNYAIIERNENEYDLKLNDGMFQTQQNPRIAQYPFPDGFDTWDFVLAIAGN